MTSASRSVATMLKAVLKCIVIKCSFKMMEKMTCKWGAFVSFCCSLFCANAKVNREIQNFMKYVILLVDRLSANRAIKAVTGVKFGGFHLALAASLLLLLKKKKF